MTPKLSQEAKLLSIYIGEADKWRGKPLYAAILETLKAEKIAGATVTRGVAGFGAHSHIHSAAILRLSEDLPLLIQVVDSAEKIEHAVEIVSPMVAEGLITVADVQVVRYTQRYLNPLPSDRLVEEVMTPFQGASPLQRGVTPLKEGTDESRGRLLKVGRGDDNRDGVSREVVTISPQDSVATAWQKMFVNLIKAMPVVNEDGTVAGMLTDEDLLERAGVPQRLSVAQQMDASLLDEETARFRHSPLKVGDVMSAPAITVRTKDSLGLAAARMASKGIKRLPVVDEQGKLAGVFSRVDILRLVANKESRKANIPTGAAQTVQDVMSRSIPAVTVDDGLGAIIEALLEHGSHRVIVLDQQGKAIGLISDSDVVARIQPEQQRGVLAALLGKVPAPVSDVTAGKLMSAGVLTAASQTPLVEAARMMMSPKRKWLVVVDSDGRAIGLVDRQILLMAMTSA